MMIKPLIALFVSAILVTTAMAAGSSSSSTRKKAGDFENGVKAVKSEQYKDAVFLFGRVVQAKPGDADAWNYLGFSNRKLKQFDQAFSAYEKALAINPKHRGANEYLGELYLQTGDLDKARTQLQTLDRLCTFGCEEYDDLKAAIAAHQSS